MTKSQKPNDDLAAELDLADQQGDLLRRITTLEQQLDVEKRQRKLADARNRTLQESLTSYQQQEEILKELDARKIRGHALASGKILKGASTAVLCCNDWHAEENVDARVVNGRNVFNLDICTARVNRLWVKALELLEFCRGFTTIDDLHLWVGGDLLNGYIHEETQEANFLGPADACEFVEGLICDGLETLVKSAGVKSITVLCNYGNHGRSTARMRASTGAANSWEFSSYRHLNRLYRDHPKVRIVTTRAYHHEVEIQGWKVRLHHGDAIRYQGGVGGISIPVNKAIAQWNKTGWCDYDLFGHWHQYLDEWRWTSCGCLVGWNAYAVRIKAEFQTPTQTLVVFNRQHGKILALPIFVADQRENEGATSVTKGAKLAR